MATRNSHAAAVELVAQDMLWTTQSPESWWYGAFHRDPAEWGWGKATSML